ncbi:MAG: hypothetical protein OXT67_04985 [Zetaproteobacteria bacterium]|nr:hypothetical protein [Zetaproteobacteria bacterium]
MPAEKKQNNEKFKKYYSHVVINKNQRTGLMTVMFLCWIIVSSLVMTHLIQDSQHWIVVAIISSFASIPVIFFPIAEQWVYEPWQAKARKYEHHHKD